MNTQSIKNKNKGFTIVETLVAISILVLALTGPLVIISQALKASYFSRDQVTAFYLAQEAVEYIRNLRDETSLSNSVSYTQWLSGVTGGSNCATTGTCINKYEDTVPTYKFNMVHTGTSYSFAACDSSGCAPLAYDDQIFGDAIPYGGGGTKDSPFTRTIWLTTVPGDPKTPDAADGEPLREAVVHVEITWMQGTAKNKFVLEDHLLNWKLQQ